MYKPLNTHRNSLDTILIILLCQSAVSAKVEPVGAQPQWPVHRVCAPDLRPHLSVMARPKLRTDNRNANIRAGGTACYLNDWAITRLGADNPATPALIIVYKQTTAPPKPNVCLIRVYIMTQPLSLTTQRFITARLMNCK